MRLVFVIAYRSHYYWARQSSDVAAPRRAARAVPRPLLAKEVKPYELPVGSR